MGKLKYYYNPETCQYERATWKLKDVISYCAGVLAVGCFMFVGIAAVHNRFTDSPLEKSLRKENSALLKHKDLLEVQLAEVESILAQLQDKDRQLYRKLFDEEAQQTGGPSINKEQVLMASAPGFRKLAGKVESESESLTEQSANSRQSFGESIHLTKEDIVRLKHVPTLQPVSNPNLDLLVSGFGTRINPFHKGRYQHPGADFAAPRGTSVMATADGRVSSINKTELEAGYGNYIDIDHGNGYVTRYAHLEDILVKRGQAVTKGMFIGTVGNSGGSVAPHLHYEVMNEGNNIDPIIFMIENITPSQYQQLTEQSKKINQSLD